jgi:carboxyl-terminal processing protease
LRSALIELTQGGMQGLVLDLRFNGGGLLTSGIEVADLLVGSGRIVSTAGRNAPQRIWDAKQEGTFEGFPIVAIVNRTTASASEIVAACLQDHQRAVIVGERSWGKGTVQSIEELEGGTSAVRLTIATYWRPSGQDIHKRRNATDADAWGVRPDEGLEVKLDKEQYQDLALARRNRDITPLAELISQKTKTQPAPESPSAAAPDAPPVPIPDAGEDEAASPPLIDPQLDRAIEYLEKEIQSRVKQPRAA